jgi:hypothetical protein
MAAFLQLRVLLLRRMLPRSDADIVLPSIGLASRKRLAVGSAAVAASAPCNGFLPSIVV